MASRSLVVAKNATVKKAKAKKAVASEATVMALSQDELIAPQTPVATTPVVKKTKTTKKAPVKKSTVSSSKSLTLKELGTSRHPLGHLLVEKTLREGGFRGGISSDKTVLERYSTDESIFSIRPQVVIQPKDPKDVERAVALLAKETKRFPSLSLTPRSAGTGLGGGSLTDSVVVDIATHMHRIDEPIKKKGEVNITVEPGAMWRDVEKRLKKEGVYLPSYPASKDICTIGGAVSNNSAGPDSLRFGHTANYVASLNVVLYDGNTYTIAPMDYSEWKARSKKTDAYASILAQVVNLVEKNESAIKKARPKTTKNTAGYALWDVFDTSVAEWKKGKGMLDMTRLISGSQGTIGIITSITLKTVPIKTDTKLIAIPIFDLADASAVINESLKYDPINVEMFDGFTFDLALRNPDFFRDRLGTLEYYQVLVSMYTTYHIRFKRTLPEFILLITLDPTTLGTETPKSIVEALRKHHGSRARLVDSPIEREMYWQVRRASYSLSKLQDKAKRPAAFLEDTAVPPESLAKYFGAIKTLLKKYNLTAAVHGHGGNGHLHFYPLIDFTNKTTPALIVKIADEFFATAVKLGGNLCGEHNDGIIRTPHLSKMFSKETIGLFEKLEHIFDPDDIFNPGKKVHPRFDIKDNIRHTN